jgi:two-component system sensor histidine kinase HydH
MKLAARPQGRLPLIIGVAAVVLGLLLAGLLGFVYALVQGAAVTLVHDQALSFVSASVRRFNALGHPPTPADMQAYLDEQRPAGLRYMALWRPEAGILVDAGEAREPLSHEMIAALPPEQPRFLGDGRVRLRMAPPERPLPPQVAGNGAPRPPPGAPPPYLHGHPDSRAPHPQAVLEFEPIHANRLHRFALLSLGVGLLVVVLVVAGAAGLIRLLRRQADLAERIEHARRLSALGEMAAVIAHEIRNPLTALKGHAQLLRKSLAGDPRADKAGRVVGEALRLQDYLNDLLEFARKGRIDPQPTDPARLLRDSVEATRPDRIHVSDQGAPRLWPMDAARMQQALTNVLRNALQVSPPDAPVEARVFADNGNLVFEVRDAGPGIASGDEERIFEPFYTRKSGGTGLGLALAQRIVAQHRGTIRACNAAEGGAVFRIALERT